MTDLSEIKLLKVSEVAAAMRLSEMTVYRMIHSGELRAVKVGQSFRVPEDVVHQVWALAQANGRGVGQGTEISLQSVRAVRDRSGGGEIMQVFVGDVAVWSWASHIDGPPSEDAEALFSALERQVGQQPVG